jgi:phage/plasmid-like protein (TIGR03299 family)
MTHGVRTETARIMQWQVLGEALPGDGLSAEEALRHGHLANWNVRKAPEFTIVDGKTLVVPDRHAVVRDNPFTHEPQVIGSVGNVFTPIQNEEHTGFLDALVDESGSNIVAAGATDNGKKVFVTMKIPGHIRIGGVDPIENYITAVNGHDGGTKFGVMVHPIRSACTNVLTMGKGYAYTVRHTKNAMNALGEARRALDLTFGYMDRFQEEAERLINTTLTADRFEQIIAEEYGPAEDAGAAARTRAERKVEQMLELFNDSMTQEGIRDTAWAGLNAITEWEDHFSPVRGNDRDASRAARSLFDPSKKNDALALIQRATRREAALV